MTQHLFELFDIIGTISFAISGAMTGIKKRLDLFGVLFLGVLTAVGGGMLRDVLLGQFPPRAFTNGIYVGTAALSALLLFLMVRRFGRQYTGKEEMIRQINNVFDAVGLGAFTVTGVQVAQAAGHGDNLFFSVFLGMITGIGGGYIRDLSVKETPIVLKKQIYALAALLGGISYCLLAKSGLAEHWAGAFCILLVFFIRMLATYYRWNLPRALDEEHPPLPED